MRERVKPMKEPRKPHGDKIHPNDPADGPEAEAERQREQQQKEKGERRE